MNEIQVFSFMSKFSADIVLLGLTVFVLTVIVCKIPYIRGTKLTYYLPYLLGVICYACYSLAIGNGEITADYFNYGLTVGGLASIMLTVTGQDAHASESKKQKIVSALVIILSVETAQKRADEILKIKITETDELRSKVIEIIGDETGDKREFLADYITEILITDK